jgi:hypothetical protein
VNVASESPEVVVKVEIDRIIGTEPIEELFFVLHDIFQKLVIFFLFLAL